MNSLWIWQSCGCVYPADTSLQNELCPLLSVVMADNDSVPRRSYQRVLEHKAICELAYCLRLLPTAPSHPHPLPPPCSVPQCVWLVAQTPSIRIALQCSNEEGGERRGRAHISNLCRSLLFSTSTQRNYSPASSDSKFSCLPPAVLQKGRLKSPFVFNF